MQKANQKYNTEHKKEDNLKIEGTLDDVLKVSVPKELTRAERLKTIAFKNVMERKNKK